ncbi:MAG: DUF4349 domain-containing protein [Clostridia bacterium]|nr:DUF4349 domain-containing protein [Clostridia bacterium]
MKKTELYKREVDSLHPDEKLLSDIENMMTEEKPKKQRIKKISSIVAVCLVVLTAGMAAVPALFGAKSADRAESEYIYTRNTSAALGTNGKFTLYDEEFAPQEDGNYDAVAPGAVDGEEDRTMVPIDSRKLIKDAFLNVQTKDYDDFSEKLEQSMKTNGGYVESSNISVSSYDGHRFGELVLRVPSEKLDAFLSTVSDASTVTSKTVSVRDVTTSYIDIESRITALETEQTTLLSLLQKAESLSDVLEIQSRLTSVRSDLESMKSQLKSLDSQITFSKVTLSVSEVMREQSAKKEGFFSEVASRLSDNFYEVSTALREMAIKILSSVPYLVLILIPVAIIVIVVRVIRRRKIK